MKYKNLFACPSVWIVLILLAGCGIFYIGQNFEKANSLINIDITMDRETALERAVQLAQEFEIGPEDYKQTAAFRSDSRFQIFVELEAGGIDTFTQVAENGYYYAYLWTVRHFKEQNANETVFWFKPNGETYGFNEKIPESESGAALSQEEAQKLAEHHAIYNWDVDLTPYNLIQKSKEERISGRVDHTFVYERVDKTLKDARFRLELGVSGDKLTTVDYKVKIPEDFDRRYSEMRSANDTIQMISTGVKAILYGLIGIVFGIFFLMRSRRLIWKPAAYWGMAITFASVFLVSVNHLPFAWFSYDTSTSESNFMLQQILNGLMGAAGLGAIIALSLMTAEGLGRTAFPQHIQWWKLWSKNTGSSFSVLGQTMAGYLFAIFILAFDVFFYITTTTHFGWWSPAGTLSDPNILATYMPWFDSIAISLQAGFWEEALFRAVPIAGIVILTKNRKSRNFWIIVILLLQTLIFGAAHASYAQQPSYARMLEMIIPFTIIGIIYIYFGILPGVIAHYSVDVFWISLPLWVSSAPGIWLDRGLVLLFLFLPLIIVLFLWFRKRRWTVVSDEERNIGWQIPDKHIDEEHNSPVVEFKKLNLEKWTFPLSLAGLIIWILVNPFTSDVPILAEHKKEAVEVARNELKSRYDLKLDEWTVLTSIADEADIRDIFVWQEGGGQTYNAMLRTFLAPPYWNIRFVKTKGKAEAKTEEYVVEVMNDGKILGVSHKIPQAWPGKNLTQLQALQIADSILFERFSIKLEHLKEISVSPEKQENRTDWEIVYADTTAFQMSSGQGRYLIDISGDEVTQAYSYVHVPEDWLRSYKKKQSKISIIKTISNIIVIGTILFGLVMGIIRWTRKKFSLKIFVAFSILFALFYAIETITSWPTLLSGYNTQLPIGNYITTLLIGIFISGIFFSLFNGIFVASTPGWLPVIQKPSAGNLLQAIALGFSVVGILALAQSILPKSEPLWPDLSYLNGTIPSVTLIFSKTANIIIYPVFAIILFLGIRYFTHGWTENKWIGIFISLIAGLAIMGMFFENLNTWLISGIIISIFIATIYYLFVRFHFEWIPISFGLIPIVGMIKEMIIVKNITTIVAGIIMILITCIIFYWWYGQIMKYSTQKREKSLNGEI